MSDVEPEIRTTSGASFLSNIVDDITEWGILHNLSVAVVIFKVSCA